MIQIPVPVPVPVQIPVLVPAQFPGPVPAQILVLPMPGMIPVLTAYHVTNAPVVYLGGIPQPHPDWTELIISEARNAIFDQGGLYGLECAFFTTTRWRGDLPSISVYPRTRQAGVEYWRLQVPLSRFNDYRIKLCVDPYAQGMLVMCQPGEFNGRRDITDDPDNGFLWRDPQNNWFTNDYSNPTTKYFVNFAVMGSVEFVNFGVLGNVDITGCEWDFV